MARHQEKKPSRGILWRILLALAALVLFAVLELGKHTILGWALAAAALIAFIILRTTVLKEKGRGLRFLAWLGLFAVFALILWISYPPVKNVPAVAGKTGGTTEVLHTGAGDLTGVYTQDKAVEVYAGIPYAQPPVGELRWKEPQKALPWQGVLAADHFAPMSMQVTDSPIFSSLKQIIGYHDYQISLSDNYRAPVSEDSLYLNIWKPAGDISNAPVLVYVHGGSLQTGQPWYEDYSGESMARDGVIVVNMHYRLGIFGFFADEALAAESPNHTTGNYGLLDQIAALQWVQDNIASFGGDPTNVTLSGESAGSACVTALCTSPLAKGLFRRVVAESSTVTAIEPAHSFRLMDEALKEAQKTKERWKVSSVSDLRSIPAEKLASEMNYHHHITVDGYVLPTTPYEAYKNGAFNEEAQLHGFNGEEATPFILFSQANMKNYESKIRRVFGEKYTERVLELFPASTDAEAKKNWADIDSILLFIYGHICLQRQASLNAIPSYVYHFTKTNGRLGDWHSGEEVYLYGNIPEKSRLYDARDRELSKEMKQYFLNFIRTGDPNGAGLPEWEKIEARYSYINRMPVMEFGDQTGMTVLPERFESLMKILDEMQGFPIVIID